MNTSVKVVGVKSTSDVRISVGNTTYPKNCFSKKLSKIGIFFVEMLAQYIFFHDEDAANLTS